MFNNIVNGFLVRVISIMGLDYKTFFGTVVNLSGTVLPLILRFTKKGKRCCLLDLYIFYPQSGYTLEINGTNINIG